MKTQSIAFLALFCLGVDPIQTSAQIIPDSVYSSPAVNQHDECQTALRNVKEKVSNAGGFVDQLYFSNDFQYHNQPSGVTRRVFLSLGGSGAENIFNSPIFLTSLSQTIFDNCSSTGLVNVHIPNPNRVDDYGLVNGKAQKFVDCSMEILRRNGLGIGSYIWGVQDCA